MNNLIERVKLLYNLTYTLCYNSFIHENTSKIFTHLI